MPKIKVKGKIVHLPYTKKSKAMAKKFHKGNFDKAVKEHFKT